MSDVATITAAVVAEDPAQQAILDKHAEAIRACGERVRKRSLDELHRDRPPSRSGEEDTRSWQLAAVAEARVWLVRRTRPSGTSPFTL